MDISNSIYVFATASTGVLNNSFEQVLSTIGTVLSILTAVCGVIVATYKYWKKKRLPFHKLNQFIDENYSKEAKKTITRYYVQTKGQDIDPCDQEEIREDNGKFVSQNLIDFFIKKAFVEESYGKYYLVLADSGMGKTTFLLRLYREIVTKNRVLRNKRKKDVVFVPLARSSCIGQIQKIENPENAILLLDALDENPSAIEDYVSFLSKLISCTDSFYRIVITCRTHFFPNRAAEPEDTGRIRVGIGDKNEEIIKKYISPFSDIDVQYYLKKRYRFNKTKRREAYNIVLKVPVLMARPIILNWVDYLCDPYSNVNYTYEIYSKIIQQWIKRESLNNRKQKNALYELSIAITNYMIANETTTMPATKVETIANRKEIQIRPIIAKSRSLLNRNGGGEYKFAHRSFLEFFIVDIIFDKMQFPENIQFWFKLSNVRRFFFEYLLSSGRLVTSGIYNFELSKDRVNNYKNIIDIFLVDQFQYIFVNKDNGFSVEVLMNPIQVVNFYHNLFLEYVSVNSPGYESYLRKIVNLERKLCSANVISPILSSCTIIASKKPEESDKMIVEILFNPQVLLNKSDYDAIPIEQWNVREAKLWKLEDSPQNQLYGQQTETLD